MIQHYFYQTCRWTKTAENNNKIIFVLPSCCIGQHTHRLERTTLLEMTTSFDDAELKFVCQQTPLQKEQVRFLYSPSRPYVMSVWWPLSGTIVAINRKTQACAKWQNHVLNWQFYSNPHTHCSCNPWNPRRTLQYLSTACSIQGGLHEDARQYGCSCQKLVRWCNDVANFDAYQRIRDWESLSLCHARVAWL